MTPENIKALRQQRGWTQQQLATEVGVAISSVARWESPKGKPPKGAALQTLQRLMAEDPAVPSDGSGTSDLPPEKVKYIEQIMAQMGCPKEFHCATSGYSQLCKAQDIGLDAYLECLESNGNDCLFSVLVDHRHLCQCPLRVYLAKYLNK